MGNTISFGDAGYRNKANEAVNAAASRQLASDHADSKEEALIAKPFETSDLTFEGVFGQYYFETRNCVSSEPGEADPIDAKTGEPPLLWLRTSLAQTTEETDEKSISKDWLALGVHSKFDGEGVNKYGRPPAEIVIVMDVSGSMNDSFAHYSEGTSNNASKMVCITHIC